MTASIQDPRGILEEGYGFIGADGKKSCWPPLWANRVNDERYWVYTDQNSCFGLTVNVPDDHQFMRDLMHELKPTFCLSLHETVQSETRRHVWWTGADLLTIEIWPMSPAEFRRLWLPIPEPLENPLGWIGGTLVDWARHHWNNLLPWPDFLRYQGWKRARKTLRANPHFDQSARIAKRYEDSGHNFTGWNWTRYFDYFGLPMVGPGRMITGPEMVVSEWRTITEYAIGNFGCPGITTESFPTGTIGLRGVDDRVAQQVAYVTAVLDELEEDNEQ
jgi:hypothetical protein